MQTRHSSSSLFGGGVAGGEVAARWRRIQASIESISCVCVCECVSRRGWCACAENAISNDDDDNDDECKSHSNVKYPIKVPNWRGPHCLTIFDMSRCVSPTDNECRSAPSMFRQAWNEFVVEMLPSTVFHSSQCLFLFLFGLWWCCGWFSTQLTGDANDYYCLHRLMTKRMIYRTIFFVINFFLLFVRVGGRCCSCSRFRRSACRGFYSGLWRK